MRRLLSHPAIAASAAVVSALSGVVGGFLANQWHWGIAVGVLLLIAMFAGLEGLKAIGASRAPSPDRTTSVGPDQSQSGTTAAAGTPLAPDVRVSTTRSVRMSHSVIGGNIGNVDLSRRTHVHVGGLAALILAALMLLGAAGGTLTLAVGPGGRLAGDQPPDTGRYAAIFEQTSGPSWLALHGLTPDRFQQKFDELKGQGFRLVQFSGYSLGNEERFAAMFEQQSGPPQRPVYGLTSDQYQQKFDELSSQGFRLVQFSGYSLGSQERFAAMFEQQSGPPQRPVYGLTSDQYQQKFDELSSQGFRLVQFSGYSLGSQERFAAIFQQQDGPPWLAFHGLTPDRFQQKFDELKGQGFRLVGVNGYSLGSQERFAAMFEQQSGPPQRAVYGLTSDQYQQKFDELSSQGFRLVQFSGYSIG
ncbi:hypothetical protein [Sphaerisporangium corydalis]|uniref:Uncharacterized protein n=1 Tax=Sphaerisporangium corydalis TaxID=1441875 RepID=A0ABV9E4P8_9ACTN|nr:hypothetical protein [Sphaerisporangium corydalis]